MGIYEINVTFCTNSINIYTMSIAQYVEAVTVLVRKRISQET